MATLSKTSLVYNGVVQNPDYIIVDANGDIIAEDFRIRYDNDGTAASYSIADSIAALQRQIDDLRGG